MKDMRELLHLCDLWTYLKHTEKAIVLYGMGDGADKILDVCGSKDITVRAVFASDDFVRGQSFRGYTVQTYAAVKKAFGDLIILVSFATHLESVLAKIDELGKYDEVYAPDVPVFGGGLFDSAYFSEHFEKFRAVYDMLADELSRAAYYGILKYKLTGDIAGLRVTETPVSEAYQTIIRPKSGSVYVDIGAYNGDTLREYVSYAGSGIKAYAFEPDPRNFKKLCASLGALPLASARLMNLAAWDKRENLTFYTRSGRNSAHTAARASFKAKIIPADAAANHIDAAVDFINIDAEGSDLNALIGLHETLVQSRPTVSCALYHRNEDMFAIPLHLAEEYGHYKMYVRHFPYIPAWDTNVYITDD